MKKAASIASKVLPFVGSVVSAVTGNPIGAGALAIIGAARTICAVIGGGAMESARAGLPSFGGAGLTDEYEVIM